MFVIHCLGLCLSITLTYSYGPSGSRFGRLVVFSQLMAFYQVFCIICKHYAMSRNKTLTLKIVYWLAVFDAVVFFIAAMVVPVYVSGKVAIGREVTDDTIAENITIPYTFPAADKYTFADTFPTAGNSTFAGNSTIDDNSTTTDNSIKSINFIYPTSKNADPYKSALVLGYLYAIFFNMLFGCCLVNAIGKYGHMKKGENENLNEEAEAA